MQKYKYTDETKKKHMHELAQDGVNYKPLMGTTTIINEVLPPPLAWWASAQALKNLGFISEKNEPDQQKRMALAMNGLLEVKRVSEMKVDDYMKWLNTQYRNHDEYKKEKGKAGTDKHEVIETWVNACVTGYNGKPLAPMNEEIKTFIEWAQKDVDKFLWSEAHCYSEKLWVGGICDLGFLHKNGMTIIGDNKPSIYPKHFIQTAAYGIQIKENGLFNADGSRLMPRLYIDGYCIYDYNKGIVQYLSGVWVDKLERTFVQIVEMYNQKDLTGSATLQ